VVIDTAPTGHTILLLDAALAFHREVERQSRAVPESVQRLLPILRDPAATRILLIVLPEATPVHEAADLQLDLRRAGIEPFAWVVNQVFSGLQTADPGCRHAKPQNSDGCAKSTDWRHGPSAFNGLHMGLELKNGMDHTSN
jgi:arsenite-transporting ATPase